MTTGRRPFGGAFREAVMYAMMHEEAPAPSSINPDIPDDLDHIINQCLQRDRSERYASLGGLLVDLGGEAPASKGGPVAPTKASTAADSSTTIRPAQRTSATGSTWLTLVDSRQKKLMAGALVVLVLALFVFRGLGVFPPASGTGSLPAAMHMAVLPFDTFSEDPDDRSFSNGLAHLVATNLLRMEHNKEELWIIPVREVLGRNVTSAGDARDKFGINLAVSGTIVELANTLQITLDVTDARTLRVVESTTIELKDTSPQTVQDQVMVNLAKMLDMQSPEDAKAALLAGQTDDPEAYKLYIQGMGFMQQYQEINNIEQAIQLFERAIEIDSTYTLAYAGAGFAYSRMYYHTNEVDFIEPSKRYSQQAMELNDELAEVWITAGRVSFDAGDREQAIASLEKAQSLDPENYEANRRLASYYAAEGRYEEAVAYYERAIDIQPNYWDAYNALGIAYGSMERREDAIAMFEKVLELSPENAFAYQNLGLEYFDLGDTLKTIEVYRKAIELAPSAAIYNNLAWTLMGREEYREALDLLEKAVELSDNDSWYWNSLGEAYYRNGDSTNAMSAWRRAIELAEDILNNVNPADEWKLRAVIDAYAKIGEVSTAERYLQRYIDLGIEDARSFYWIGLWFEYIGNRGQALIYLERALENGLPVKSIQPSPWLDGLFDDPAFNALVERYRVD